MCCAPYKTLQTSPFNFYRIFGPLSNLLFLFWSLNLQNQRFSPSCFAPSVKKAPFVKFLMSKFFDLILTI